MSGLFGHQAERGHSGLGVDLEQEKPGRAALVVPAEVGAACAAATEQPVRVKRNLHAAPGDLARHLRRADMLGQPLGIFGIVIVKAARRQQLGHGQRFVADHCGGQLASGDERLGEQVIEFLPGPFDIAADRVAVIAALGDDRDTDRRALVDRLQHIRPRHRVSRKKTLAVDDNAVGHRDAVRHQHLLGQFLVDRDHRGFEPRMRIGNLHQIEHALDAAVLARAAVECVEHDVGAYAGEHLRDVAVHVDGRHLMAQALERRDDILAAHQRHLALGGPAAHQHGDMQLHDSPPACGRGLPK